MHNKQSIQNSDLSISKSCNIATSAKQWNKWYDFSVAFDTPTWSILKPDPSVMSCKKSVPMTGLEGQWMKRRKAHGKPNVHGATIQMLQEKRINTVEKILSISDCGELILSTLRMPNMSSEYPIPLDFFISFLLKMTINYIWSIRCLKCTQLIYNIPSCSTTNILHISRRRPLNCIGINGNPKSNANDDNRKHDSLCSVLGQEGSNILLIFFYLTMVEDN